ncbi:hypothetical protein RDWZM_010028 [Blomia tropicalis]|uniref:ABC transporter domain-containing protein n=1 Tax=Blomia tropicalis TaxID=40697 RepID=A0A9Q0RHB7_BLOTA|nr:hypothetical protein RDWZM_010028 [Blomia tropicalis]
MGIAFIDLKSSKKYFMGQSNPILSGVSGQFNYGTLNAIIGPKYSGKTDLAKCLAGRNNINIDFGTQFYINEDIPPRVAYFHKTVETNLLLSLTVQESLEYTFRFRSIKSSSDLLRRSMMNDLIQMLQLKEIQHVELRNINNEERIRVLIATSLATTERPNLIFLNEPFFEIDAVGIENLTILMKRLVRYYSIAIILTVEQILDSEILTIFDKLYVLSIGGQCIYEGTVEHLALFLRESDVTIMSKIQTPMERLMKIASKPDYNAIRLAQNTSKTRNDILHLSIKFGINAPNGIETKPSSITMDNIIEQFNRSSKHLYRTYWQSITFNLLLIIFSTTILITAYDKEIGVPDSCYNRSPNQTMARFAITNHNMYQNENDRNIIEQIGQHPMVDTIIGQQLIDQNVKFIFVLISGLTLTYLIISARVVNTETIVAINEHQNGWLNIGTYFIVKNILDPLVPLINTIICVIIAYLMTNQVVDIYHFIALLYSIMLSVICSQSAGSTIGILSLFNIERYQKILMITLFIIMIAFNGFLIPLNHIALWLNGFVHLSFLKLTYEMALISIYGFGRCQSSYVMDEFNIKNDEKLFWINSLIVFIHIIIYRLIFWLIISKKANQGQTYIERESTLNDDDEELENEYYNNQHSFFKNQ